MNRYMLSAMLAYLIWGIVPLVIKQLANYPVPAIILVRSLIALLVTAGLFWLKYRGFSSTPKQRLMAFLTGLFLTLNWHGYVYLVNFVGLTDASLSYFIFSFMYCAFGTGHFD